MEKRNVVIYVAGQRFSITTTDSEEYVIDIGQKVDVMIKGIQKDNPRLNRDACAILAALDLCDDETKLRQMMEVLRTQVKDYLESNEKLREENETLKAQLAALKASNSAATEDTEGTEDNSDTETESSKTSPASLVLSRSESLVMADASERDTRHTAFVGKDFRSGKKNKKNKKHGKPQPVQTSTPAPAVSSTATADSTDDDSQSPYHQFSIFDDLE